MPFSTGKQFVASSVEGARRFRGLRAGGGEHRRRSGIVLAILPATGDWRCSYCQVGRWWLSASRSGAGSHSRRTPRTPQPLSKPHRLTQQRTKQSTPTGAPNTASSGATIAIASERGVGGVSSAGYPIAELARCAFGNTSAEIDIHPKTPCASQATTPKDFIGGASGHLKIHAAHRPHFSTYLVAQCSRAVLFVSNRGQARSDSAGLTDAFCCLSATALAARGAERIRGLP
jgi:hypothetical protein